MGAILLALGLFGPAGLPAQEASGLQVEPSELSLRSSEGDHALLVTATNPEGRRVDATRRAAYASSDPRIAAVSPEGRIRPVADGEAVVSAAVDGKAARVKVTVSIADAVQAPSYRHDVVPVLTRFGCSQGACHGKEAGQNGFKLSLRGYAGDEDWPRLVAESFGRRVNHAAPDLSLLLAKPSGRIPHKGGVLFEAGSRPYVLLSRWIEAGTPKAKPDERTLEGIELLGGGRELRRGEEQPLLVRARWSDGRVTDVTWLCQFYSNDGTILAVTPQGVVRALREGASTVRAHFEDRVAVAAFTVPHARPADPALYAGADSGIDLHVFAKLKELHLPPSGPASDGEFLRRAHLDAIGTLPKPEEVRAFLADRSPDKRAKLVDALLARPEFTDYWAQLLGDLLQNRKERDHDVRGSKGVRAFHQWLREQVAANRPWNELARDVLTASGDTRANPQIGYWIVTVGEQRQADRSEAVASVAQTFLGTRILCAKCHNHPDERYTQDDYYHFAAFFTAVSLDRKKPEQAPSALAVMTPQEQEQRKRIAELQKQIRELEAQIGLKKDAELKKVREQMDQRGREMEQARKRMEEVRLQPVKAMQPRTGKALDPQPLDRVAVRVAPGEDPRKTLTDWITDPKNGYFTGSIVNRLWRHFMGVGLVEPVDDLRPSNPPVNEPLWRHLNDEFVRSGFDLRHLMRLILTSRTYQLSSATRPENEQDRRFHSHAYAKRLGAEVLLDAISQATGVPDAFQGYPVGLRAIQLPDPTVESHFLRLFGRSDRVTACACERNGEVTLPQLLHLQNGESTVQKIRSAEGRLERLLRGKTDPAAAAEILFLSTLSRLPRESEKATIGRMIADSKDPAEVLRDLFWALLNSKEFVFNH